VAEYRCESQGHLYAGAVRAAEDLYCDLDRSRLVLVDGTASPAPAMPVVRPARDDSLRPVRAVRITFDDTVVTASLGEQVMLGRDPRCSPYAEFFGRHTQVSRRHAVLGLAADGRAWIQDWYSTNLTRVSGEPLPAGGERDLRPNDQVRLCADVAGKVEFVREDSDVT